MAKKSKSVGVKSGGLKKTEKKSNSKGSGVFGLKKSISKKSSSSVKSAEEHPKAKPKSSTKKDTSRLLQNNASLFIIFFLIGLLTIATFALMMINISSDSSIDEDSAKLQYCTTPECTIVSSLIMKHMDPEVDPCDDFYKSACGKFSETQIPAKEQTVEYSVGARQTLLIDVEMINILNSKDSKSVDEKILQALFENFLKVEEAKDPAENILEKQKISLKKIKETDNLRVVKVYASRKLKPENWKAANEMAEEIKLAFSEEFKKVDWLDEKSRKNALKKLADMQLNNGGLLLLEGMRSENSSDFIYDPSSRNESAQVNFFSRGFGYDHVQNKMLVGAFLLLVPSFDVVLPSYHNFGASGPTFGSAMAVGFHYELIKDVWSKESAKKYAEKIACFKNQYGKLELHKHKVNGTRASDSAVVNQVGLKIAYNAMKKNLERKDGDAMVRLPGLQHLSPEQMFFYSYASMSCANPIKSGGAEEAINGEFTPAELRVNAILSNSAEFAKAFNCKPKSRMNPVKKCQVF